ncbi:hypothetical protein [Mangrovihabitans endophyticus]|uniref:Uncharacterized protein n=1 Tax=Mangrovihabitans endophyticus TaxID=1751298 RepID=A0A8J3C120_9ACTN|nr:hypothetical protein [Mangrovihabitans endophyticus]GGL03739.1 hypothetical protein GCM10012284_42920 [Mangrovihabitans endophyticus]
MTGDRGLTDGDSEYTELLRRLARLEDEAVGHRAEATRWHDDRVAAVDEALRTAEETVRAARQRVGRAERERDRVDAEVWDIWSEISHRYGSTADRFGKAAPGPTVPRQRDRDAESYAAEARALVDYQKPAAAARPALYVVLGVAGGVLGAVAHQLLRWAGQRAGGDLAATLPVVALIAMVLGPVLAAVEAKRVSDRRGIELDHTAVATVLLAGLVTAGLAFAVLRG